MRKTNLSLKLVVEFDDNIAFSYLDDLLIKKLAEMGLDLVLPFGHSEYVLILKDPVTEK